MPCKVKWILKSNVVCMSCRIIDKNVSIKYLAGRQCVVVLNRIFCFALYFVNICKAVEMRVGTVMYYVIVLLADINLLRNNHCVLIDRENRIFMI